MKIFSFDNKTYSIKRNAKQFSLFNIFQKNIILKNVIVYPYTIPIEYEMRLDRVSEYLYGSSSYMEELMVLNDIISPYSIKEGQIIYFCKMNDLEALYTSDNLPDNQQTEKISISRMNSKDDKIKKISQQSANIKPENLKQLKVDKDNKIQIINTFE
jgi:hypothetical protein